MTSTRFNPTNPFAPAGNLKAFFGSPEPERAIATVQQTFAFIDHDFGNGLTVKNGTLVAQYNKFYQNIYPEMARYPALLILPDGLQSRPPITTRPIATTSSTKRISSIRRSQGLSSIRLASAPRLVNSRGYRCAIPEYFQPAPTRLPPIHFLRPTSAP